jgi:hypothetical protein
MDAAACLLEVCRETEGIEPERRRQRYRYSALEAENASHSDRAVNAPAVSPGWSSALVLRRALHNRHPPSVAERRFPFWQVYWVRRLVQTEIAE